jgi:Putative prokaryotic signal transducing protein
LKKLYTLLMNQDPYADPQELASRYAAMNDVQLEELANVAYSLTESARAALAAEISRRKADIKLTTMAPEVPVPADSRLVRIRQFLNVGPALLAKSVLDSAGIECFLADENTVRIDWLYSNAIGGVKLLVREEDAEAARELLDQTSLDETPLQ